MYKDEFDVKPLVQFKSNGGKKHILDSNLITRLYMKQSYGPYIGCGYLFPKEGLISLQASFVHLYPSYLTSQRSFYRSN